MPTYTPEQLEQIFQKLPDELQESIFSMETADAVNNACLAQGATDERGNKVAELTGQVLMGLILPEDFQKSLEKEAGLKKDAALNIARDITRFVFFPLKESLRQLHDIGVAPDSISTSKTKSATVAKTPIQTAEPQASAASRGQDTYRESFEEESQ